MASHGAFDIVSNCTSLPDEGDIFMLARLSFAVVAAFSFGFAPANAQEPSVFQPAWQERLFHVDAMMEYSIEVDEAIGVETLIIQDGQVLLHKAYGVEDVDTQKPLAPGAIWSVKSMTKPVVALAILMLVDEGKLELREPISTWLPDFAGDHRVTVSDLLSHKSGVSGLGWNGTEFATFEEWVVTWGMRPPEGPIGQYRYSDFNFAVAALIIADRSGQSTEDFIAERILRPLGMEDSHLTFDPTYDWASRVPSRYVKGADGFEEVWDQKSDIWYRFFPGGWGLWSSAKDYAKFLQFWIDRGSINGKQLIDPALIDLALTPHTRQVPGRWGYGLGWNLHGSDTNRRRPASFAHGGYDGTRAYAYPESNTIALVLTHSRGSLLLSQAEEEIVAVEDLGATSAAISFPRELDWSPNLSDEIAEGWIGKYSGRAFVGGEEANPVTMTIEREGENLVWKAEISSADGTLLRTSNIVIEDDQTAWHSLYRDGQLFYIRNDRRLTLSPDGRLTLKSGERVVAEASKVP